MRSDPPPKGSQRGLEGLAADLAQQRALVGNANPIYARLVPELEGVLTGASAEPSIVAKLERAWKDRTFSAYYDRPLLLLASLRADAVSTGPKHPLARALANDDAPDPSVVTRAAVVDALAPDRIALWLGLATRRVQTNEVSRSFAWRWPAHLAGCDGGARPLALVDVGASGGLNLIADALPAHWVDAKGASLPVLGKPRIVARLGFDTHPLDFLADDDTAWARACIWPGDRDRLRRFDGAVAAFRRAGGVSLARVSAPLVPTRLPEILRELPSHGVLLVYQTLVREYLGPERKEAYLRAMRAFVAAAPRGSVAWLELELEPGASNEPPAALVAHVPDGEGGVHDLVLARTSYHPRAVDVRAGVTSFARAMAR